MSPGEMPLVRGGVLETDYQAFVEELLRRARWHVELEMFYMDLRAHRDPDRHVFTLVEALRAAARRGVDVRVLLGGNTRTADIAVANLAATRYLREVGVAVRAYRTSTRHLTHAKSLIVDDVCIVGSHNWEHDALGTYRETSVWAQSPAVVSQLLDHFLRNWESSLEPSP